MGERKGVNKYYPPDYDPSKGGLNKFQGTHALRERARKLHLGILIIRFEMPYNIWCEGCENHIGMGVRYNAEKTKVGMYYSTPIYQFRMKCHLCDNHFEIKTDPANLDYEIVSGARRQERRWDPTQNEQVVPEDKNVSRKMAADAMYRLEHGVSDKRKATEQDPTLTRLEDFQTMRWHDDYTANQRMRAAMRVKRTETRVQAEKDATYRFLDPLLPPSDEDGKTAKLLHFTQSKTSDDLRNEKRATIEAQSIFARLKTKKVSPSAKKAFAQSSLTGILNQSQKNFTSFKNKYRAQSLGIVKKVDGGDCQSDQDECGDNGCPAQNESTCSGEFGVSDSTSVKGDQSVPPSSDQESVPSSSGQQSVSSSSGQQSAPSSSGQVSDSLNGDPSASSTPRSEPTSSTHNGSRKESGPSLSLSLLSGYASSTSDSD